MYLRRTGIAHLLASLMSALLLSSYASAAELVTGEVLNRSYHFEEAGMDMTYTLYVPTSYDADTPTPLIVLLHGLTSNPVAVIGYQGITAEAEARGMIVVAPYGYNEGGWYGSRGPGKEFGDRTANMFTEGAPDNLGELSELDVLNVMAIVRDEFNIDNDRTYLMGHSMGGAGTMYLGIKYHEQWAGLAAFSPAIFGRLTGPIENLQDIPVITVHGDQDELVPVVFARGLAEQYEEAGLTSRYIEIEGGDHVQAISRNPSMIKEVFDFLVQNTQ